MAAVASVQTNTVTNADSITITKPTSLAEGDLMVAFIASYDGTDPTVPADESGWTTIGTANIGNPAINMKAYYKVADSGDVSASDFTFDCDPGSETMDNIKGIIYRITSGTEGVVRDSDSNIDAASGTSPSYTIDITNVSGAVVIGAIILDGAPGGVSGYTINGTNPTWTERMDSDGANITLAVADAVTPDATALTSFSATLGSAEASSLIFVLISDQADDSATLGTINIGAAMQSLAQTGDGNVTLGTATIGAAAQSITPATPTPEWSNKDKSSTSSFTNKDKS